MDKLVRAALAGLAFVSAACGGSSPAVKGGGAPANPGDAPNAGKSTGSVVYQDQPGGFAPSPQGRPAPQDIEPVEKQGPPVVGAAPPPPSGTAESPAPKPAIKPPTQDLPPEKKAALVGDQLRRGAQAIGAHDADGAIRAARAALDIDESNVEAMLVLAHGYYLKEYDDKVEAVLNIASKLPEGQNHPVLWMLFGLMYDRTNREKEALDAYERASSLKQDYVAALNNKGVIYLKRKRYSDAIVVFERIAQIQPRSARAHAMLGAAYRGHSADVQGEERDQLLRRAELELKTAMTVDNGYAAAYFNLGILYLDADPFPGLDTITRLNNAQRFLSEYKRQAGPAGVPQADDYLAAAQKAIEREQKTLERKKKKDAEKGKEKK